MLESMRMKKMGGCLKGLNLIQSFSPHNLRITTGLGVDDPNFGYFSPSANRILIRQDKGKYSHIARHELSHAFTFYTLANNWFGNENGQPYNEFTCCMDEAFAHYFPCVVQNSPEAIMGLSQGQSTFEDISFLTASQVRNLMWSYFPLDEELYSFRYFDYPISSSWWTLRNNTVFGLPDPITQVKAFDRILVNTIGLVGSELSINSSYRYKPRYFFNLLMQGVADIGQTTELNDKQVAIKDAYNSRGLHFYPKVESISSGNISRNIFGLNEPVHVKISDCPQNTRINIYVIKHGSYTYTDGALVSTLNSFYANGFSPITNETTNASGEWTGLIWTTPSSAADAVGDYDIIVDIGSPNTPDGIIHFAFSGANVMDGFDSRTKPGLSVIDNGIDVVMAVSAFSEPQVSKSSK